MLRVMAGDTVAISAKAFYNIDKTLPGQGVDVIPVLGSAIAALASGGTAPLGEASQLAADLGTTASQSAALLPASPPSEGQGEAAPTAGLKFVLYDAEFEVVEDNTGTKIVEDKINTIQTLATDKMVMQANGFLEVFVDNQAQTPVFFDNLMVTHTPSRVLEVNSYYPSGLLMYGADMTFQAAGDEYNGYKYNSKELQTQMNLGWLDYGARMYDPAIARFMVPDRFAEKYYNLSPYQYGGLNPINYIDINGDSIELARLIIYDNLNGSNYSQAVTTDAMSQTGLTLSVSSTTGKISYAKDANGNPVISTTTDSNGNTIQIGSATARQSLIDAIDHPDMVTVGVSTTSGSSVARGTNEINLNPTQIDGFINGVVGLDNRTMGWGMTFMHELNHTKVGGGLLDSPFNPGPVVTKMNTIRSELNAQGGNYGQRSSYTPFKINGVNYLPFSGTAHTLLQGGLFPIHSSTTKYIRIK